MGKGRKKDLGKARQNPDGKRCAKKTKETERQKAYAGERTATVTEGIITQ